MGYADTIAGVLQNWWGITALIVTGFALLAWDNYKRHSGNSDSLNLTKPSPEETVTNGSIPSEEDSGELQKLRTRLRETEQEVNRLRREAVEDDQGVAHFGLAVLPETEEERRRKKHAKQVEQERDELRAEVESLKGAIAKQREKLNRFDGDRKRFKALLTDAWREGTQLRESGPSEGDARKWGDRVGHLLEAALGNDYWVDRVLKDDPDFRSAIFNSTTEQKWMESRLNRLQDLSQWVEAQESIPVRPGFDPHGRKDWKSSP